VINEGDVRRTKISRSVRKRGSDEDDMSFDDTEDEACWRGIMKHTLNYKYFQGGRVE
jgi:hypothetical protein